MRFLVLWLGLLPPGTAASFTIHGTVLDPSGAAIAGAQVSVVNRLGVARQTTTDQAGGFTLKLAQAGDMHLAVTAPGFETKNIPLARTSGQEPLTVHLNIAPQVDSVRVAGSAIDVPLSEQGPGGRFHAEACPGRRHASRRHRTRFRDEEHPDGQDVRPGAAHRAFEHRAASGFGARLLAGRP